VWLEDTARRTKRRTWMLVLGELVAIFGVVFCYLGAAMTGSFTVANPERLDHWRFVAAVYQVPMGCVSSPPW
jgi:hypothetical protein